MLAVIGVARHSQPLEAELKTMCSLVAVVTSLERAASLALVLAEVELPEPKVLDVVSDFALGPKNSRVDYHVLGAAGPMIVVGTESEEALVPMD